MGLERLISHFSHDDFSLLWYSGVTTEIVTLPTYGGNCDGVVSHDSCSHQLLEGLANAR